MLGSGLDTTGALLQHKNRKTRRRLSSGLGRCLCATDTESPGECAYVLSYPAGFGGIDIAARARSEISISCCCRNVVRVWPVVFLFDLSACPGQVFPGF